MQSSELEQSTGQSLVVAWTRGLGLSPGFMLVGTQGNTSTMPLLKPLPAQLNQLLGKHKILPWNSVLKVEQTSPAHLSYLWIKPPNLPVQRNQMDLESAYHHPWLPVDLSSHVYNHSNSQIIAEQTLFLPLYYSDFSRLWVTAVTQCCSICSREIAQLLLSKF